MQPLLSQCSATMSGLSTLLAYEEDEDDEQKQQPPQTTQPAIDKQPTSSAEQSDALSSSTVPSSPPHTPAVADRPAASDSPSMAVDAGTEWKGEEGMKAQQQPQTHPAMPDPHDTYRPRSSSSLISPPLHRLLARLPPIPAPSLPSDTQSVHAYLAGLPRHVQQLLDKRTAQSPSLISQLTALPAFHNPAILQRVLNTQHINQHDTLWTEARNETDETDEDSVDGMRRQAEREQRDKENEEREKKEEDERRQQREAAHAQRDEGGGERRDRLRQPSRDQPTATMEASAADWRERELRKRREAAMTAAMPPPQVAPRTDTSVLTPAAAALTDAKRQEAMRRAEEINKRLRKV